MTEIDKMDSGEAGKILTIEDGGREEMAANGEEGSPIERQPGIKHTEGPTILETFEMRGEIDGPQGKTGTQTWCQ